MSTSGSVYLFNLRHAKHKLGFIAKYGYTKDMLRRSREHSKIYGPERIMLVCESKVRVELMREAEWKLRRTLCDWHIGPVMCHRYNIPRGRELIYVPWSDLDIVENLYASIEKEFGCEDNEIGFQNNIVSFKI